MGRVQRHEHCLRSRPRRISFRKYDIFVVIKGLYPLDNISMLIFDVVSER